MGTLVELRDPAPTFRRLLADRFGVGVDLASAHRAFRAEIAYYRGHHLEGRDPASLQQLRERCAAVLAEELDAGLAAGAELTQLLSESLRFAPYPEAREALGALRCLGVKLVAVSNWDVSLPQTLEAVGLLQLLDGVVSSAAVGAAKPDPLPFQRALALAGCAASEALHVGDSVEEDVAGARAAGIECWLLQRKPKPAPTGVVAIGSLRELADLLAAAKESAG